MIYWYSACGNSRHIADMLSEALGEELVSISEALMKGEFDCILKEGERLGFVWPVYCWAPPKLVTDFVSKLRIHGRPGYTFLVGTCGDSTGLTEKLFRKSLSAKGLSLDAAWCLKMPETYINIKPMNLDSPDGAAAKIAAADAELPAIVESIKARERVSDMPVGSAPWLMSRVVKPLFYAFLVSDRPFRVSDACISCGLCASLCPLQNITMEDGRPHWNGNCTTCNSCYHHCPVNAISFGKATAGKGQYYFGRK